MNGLMRALIQANTLRNNDIDDEKHSDGIYDYAIQSFEDYKRYLTNYGNPQIITKLDEVDDSIVEILYFLLDEVLDMMIEIEEII